MKKVLLIVISALLLVSMYACKATDTQTAQESAETGSALTVVVGIVPEATFVEAVAGDLVDVVTLIPPGYSPANYQPTTTEMQALSDAEIYFTLQMPAERVNILPKVGDFNEDIKIVDLREAVIGVHPLLNTDGEEIETTEDEAVDPHVWLSPMRAEVMVQTIADELSEADGDNEETYQANAASYIDEIEALDSEIQETVSTLANKSFLIYHAAYGYFAHDYSLTMIAIEIEGKQATAEELQEVIDKAKEENIKTVFYQEEFDDSQAATVADEIGGAAEKTAPLSADYIQGLKNFTNALVQSGEQDEG